MTTYGDDEIRRPLRLGEDNRWEFKEIVFAGNRSTRPRRDDLADEIAAAANAQGSVLLCGVADDGDVQGMSRAQMNEWEHLLAEICSDFIHPALRVRILRKEPGAGRPIMAVEVPEGHAQYDSPDSSFVRGSSGWRKSAGLWHKRGWELSTKRCGNCG